MEDKQIIDLYWARSETAISETADKYGRYCHSIAFNILRNHEDSEECVNDTFFNAWRAMPPQRPNKLSAFLGTITRNLSLKKWEQYNAEKRGSGQVPLALEELQECVPARNTTERTVEDMELAELFDQFLATLRTETRRLFVLRYWHLYSIKEIAATCGVGESKVKTSLMRSRNRLKHFLEKEGITL